MEHFGRQDLNPRTIAGPDELSHCAHAKGALRQPRASLMDVWQSLDEHSGTTERKGGIAMCHTCFEATTRDLETLITSGKELRAKTGSSQLEAISFALPPHCLSFGGRPLEHRGCLVRLPVDGAPRFFLAVFSCPCGHALLAYFAPWGRVLTGIGVACGPHRPAPMSL